MLYFFISIAAFGVRNIQSALTKRSLNPVVITSSSNRLGLHAFQWTTAAAQLAFSLINNAH